MQVNFGESLEHILAHEGGFQSDPRDPGNANGGATNKGITFATFKQYVKRNGTVNDLKNVTDAQVAKVYKKHYWDKIKGDDLPSGVDYAVFDFAVNSGPSRAAKFLQQIVGASADGKIGPKTIEAVVSCAPPFIIGALCADRLAWLKRLSTFKTFGKGWTRRVNDVEDDAQNMANKRKIPKAVTPIPKPSLWARFCAYISSLLQRAVH